MTPPHTVEAARVTYLDGEGQPIGRPIIVTRTAVIEIWERRLDGSIAYATIAVGPSPTAPEPS